SCATAGDGVVDDEDAVAVAVVAGTTVVCTHTVVAGRRGIAPRSVVAGAECGLESIVERVVVAEVGIVDRAKRELGIERLGIDDEFVERTVRSGRLLRDVAGGGLHRYQEWL